MYKLSPSLGQPVISLFPHSFFRWFIRSLTHERTLPPVTVFPYLLLFGPLIYSMVQPLSVHSVIHHSTRDDSFMCSVLGVSIWRDRSHATSLPFSKHFSKNSVGAYLFLKALFNHKFSCKTYTERSTQTVSEQLKEFSEIKNTWRTSTGSGKRTWPVASAASLGPRRAPSLQHPDF